MARRRKPTRGERIAQEAREWVRTPFVWQQSQKGVGCDCKGLLWGVARELGFPEAESLYAKVANYSPTRPVPSALLKQGFAAIFDRVTEPKIGDVMLLKVGGRASHIAIVSGEGRAIHAQIGPKDWVKETRLDALTRMFPVDSIWRWRDER